MQFSVLDKKFNFLIVLDFSRFFKYKKFEINNFFNIIEIFEKIKMR